MEGFTYWLRDSIDRTIVLENKTNQKNSYVNLLLLLEDKEEDNEIRSLLEGEKKQAVIDYYTNKSDIIFKRRYLVYSCILDHSKQIKIIGVNKRDKWLKVFDELNQINLNVYDFGLEMENRESKIVEVINSPYLGPYNFKTSNGKVIKTEIQIYRVIKKIEELIIEIGAINVLQNIFTWLNKDKYSQEWNRYLLPKLFSPLGQKAIIHTPINYIISLCLKLINEPIKNCKQYERKYKNLIRTCEYFVYLYDLQDFSYISANMFPDSYNVDLFYRNLLYDNLFRFKQCSSVLFPDILRHLLACDSHAVNKKLGFQIDRYFDFVSKFYQTMNKNNNNGVLELKFSFFTKEEQEIIKKLCHIKRVNEKYSLPDEFDKSKNIFYKKPFILKDEDTFIFVDKNYSAWNFYEVIMDLLDYKNIDVGKNLEALVVSEAKKSNKNVYYGNYFDSSRECDLVLEDEEYITFVEIKKKTVTNKSLSGDKTQLIMDLCETFMSSQEQLLEHEVFIRNKKVINFTNGNRIELRDRKICKISLSLFDLYVFNDHFFVMNMFSHLAKIRFELSNKTNLDQSNTDKVLRKINELNKKQDNINKLMLTLKEQHQIDYYNMKFNHWFLSLELMLTFFNEQKKQNTTISTILGRLRNISYSSGDLYFEYCQINKLHSTQKK